MSNSDPNLQGPGVMFIYPVDDASKAVKFVDVQVLDWPSDENGNCLTFLHTEKEIGRQICKTCDVPFIYSGKFQAKVVQ